MPTPVKQEDDSPSTMRTAPPFRRVEAMYMAGSQTNGYRDAGKLRPREAYARVFLDGGETSEGPSRLTILPDASAWRTYLPWILQLVHQWLPEGQVQFVLLESIAHELELRNQYYQDTGKPEAASPQERLRLTRLVQEHPDNVVPFLDMSLRDMDFDEWNDVQDGSASRRQRSLELTRRAARLWQLKHHLHLCVWTTSQKEVAVPSPEEGIQWMSTHDIVQLLCKKLSNKDQAEAVRFFEHCQREYLQRQQQPQTTKPQPGVPTFRTEKDIEAALQQGKLGEGRYQVSKENPSEAFVSWKKVQWFVSSSSSMVRVIDEDRVLFQPLPKRDWEQPIGRRRLVMPVNSHSSDEKDDGTVATSTTSNDSATTAAMPTVRLVGIQQEGPRRTVVATLTEEPAMSDESAVLVVPMDIRIPKIRIQSKEWRKWLGQRLLMDITSWDVDSRYPAGHVKKIIGHVGDLETEISCLLHEHRIPLEDWSLQSRACLPTDDWQIPKDEIEQRRDLRQTHNIFSVDPVGCQDIDDCMHVRRLPNREIEVGVHIADVTYFVQLNSALDLQARKRGTTFYLVDRRFDMLPSVLSSNLCSLHGGRDRLAVSVIWTMKEDMSEILRTWYGRTVIHNVAAMTYEQADRILDGRPPELKEEKPPPPLTAGASVPSSLIAVLRDDLGLLTQIARRRRQDRQEQGGAIDLSSGDTGSELKFTIINGDPVKVQPKQTKEIHRTIEELMIWANTSVASMIKKSYPDSALLRIHRAVEEERFADLESLLKTGSITFKGKTNAELAESLRKAQSQSSNVVGSLFRSLATRAMSEALYVSTGSVGSTENLAHYGLGLQLYTHFTSPIRRYADVCVHHQLLAALNAANPSGVQKSSKSPSKIRTALEHFPESSVMSVLVDGISELLVDEEDLEIDRLIDAADANIEAITGSKVPSKEKRTLFATQPMPSDSAPFSNKNVADICKHLNEHNRLAKHSAMDCQSLFLSLYFRNHVEITQAVVTDIRENGFFCYIPKFDMRGPIFVRDMEGHVQIDPSLFGLPSDAGSEPTRGFSVSEQTRLFDSSTSEIAFKENEKLEVIVMNRACTWKPLDVVTVCISCSDWDSRARVPSPRIHLINRSPELAGTAQLHAKDTFDAVSRVCLTISDDSDGGCIDSGPSLFDFIESLPTLLSSDATSSSASSDSGSTRVASKAVSGRVSWGGFQNPDTRMAAQAAAQEAAAALKSERPVHAIDEYDANNRVAREVSARQHRLAAERRNARRSKRT